MQARLFGHVLFAFAAACALLAGMGVAVPAHVDAPGTPPFHDHVLGAYRFGFLLPPIDEQLPETSPAMAKLHQVLMKAGVPMDALALMPGMSVAERVAGLPTIKRAGTSPAQDLAIEFALLVVLVPTLSRPVRRLVAELPLLGVAAALWQTVPAPAPPRSIARP